MPLLDALLQYSFQRLLDAAAALWLLQTAPQAQGQGLGPPISALTVRLHNTKTSNRVQLLFNFIKIL